MPTPKKKPVKKTVVKSVSTKKKTTVASVKSKKENHLVLDLSPKAKKAKKTVVKSQVEKKPFVEEIKEVEKTNVADILQNVAESKKEAQVFISPGVFVQETGECGCLSCSCTPEHGTTETMNVDPDAITFSDKKPESVSYKLITEGIYLDEEDGEDFEDLGDVEHDPSFDTDYVRNKYGNYIIAFIISLLGFILYVGVSQPQSKINTVPVTVISTDTIHDTDTVTVIKEDTLQTQSSLLLEEVDSLKKVNSKLTYERDTLLVELSKYGKPVYVTVRRR